MSPEARLYDVFGQHVMTMAIPSLVPTLRIPVMQKMSARWVEEPDALPTRTLQVRDFRRVGDSEVYLEER